MDKFNVDADVYHDLKRKSELFHQSKMHFFIFAKNGFSPKLQAEAKNKLVKLVVLSDIVSVVE